MQETNIKSMLAITIPLTLMILMILMILMTMITRVNGGQ